MNPEIEIVRIPVEPSRAQQLAEAVQSARNGYLAPPRCTSLEVLTGTGGDEVTAIVRWSSAEAHAEALRGEHSAAFFSAVMALASQSPDVRKYRLAGA